jgi:hypothetical protein
MSSGTPLTQLLLHIYPAAWRAEYGLEFAETLAARPITLRIAADVLRNGLWQRCRYTEPWLLGGMFSAFLLITGTIANSIRPFSSQTSNYFWAFFYCIHLAIGYIYFSYYGKTIFSAAIASGKAALFGCIPEITLAILWALNLVHPTILDMHGSRKIAGGWVTDVCIRSEADVTPAHLLLLVPITSYIPAILTGFLGAVAAKMSGTIRQRWPRTR